MREEIIREDEYVDICPNCGGLFSQNTRGRRKKFCSEKCRTAWNHRHPNPANWKDTGRKVICPQCGNDVRRNHKQCPFCRLKFEWDKNERRF